MISGGIAAMEKSSIEYAQKEIGVDMKYVYKHLEKLSTQEVELLNLLDENPSVSFTFLKKGENGVEMVRRIARGTRNQTYIPSVKWARRPTDDLSKKINYYDLDRQDWRSMSIGRLITINREVGK